MFFTSCTSGTLNSKYLWCLVKYRHSSWTFAVWERWSVDSDSEKGRKWKRNPHGRKILVVSTEEAAENVFNIKLWHIWWENDWQIKKVSLLKSDILTWRYWGFSKETSGKHYQRIVAALLLLVQTVTKRAEHVWWLRQFSLTLTWQLWDTRPP